MPLSITQEDVIVSVLTEYKLLYDVKIHLEQRLPLAGFPWLRPSDFLRSMGSLNDLSHILGGRRNVRDAEEVLLTFWKRFEAICPKHQLFEDARMGVKDLRRCLPMYLHGDEGTTYRKSGVLVISWQSAFGYGCSKRASELPSEGIALNFLKTGFQTRMLALVCPKDSTRFL